MIGGELLMGATWLAVVSSFGLWSGLGSGRGDLLDLPLPAWKRGGAGRFQGPARSSLMPLLVPRETLRQLGYLGGKRVRAGIDDRAGAGWDADCRLWAGEPRSTCCARSGSLCYLPMLGTMGGQRSAHTGDPEPRSATEKLRR
jgi:hypothetical protein